MMEILPDSTPFGGGGIPHGLFAYVSSFDQHRSGTMNVTNLGRKQPAIRRASIRMPTVIAMTQDFSYNLLNLAAFL